MLWIAGHKDQLSWHGVGMRTTSVFQQHPLSPLFQSVPKNLKVNALEETRKDASVKEQLRGFSASHGPL